MDPFDTQLDQSPVDSYAQSQKSNKSKGKKKSQANSLFVTVPRMIRKLWATRQTEDIDKEKEVGKYVRITMKELCIYAVFLANLSICKFFLCIIWIFLVFLKPT